MQIHIWLTIDQGLRSSLKNADSADPKIAGKDSPCLLWLPSLRFISKEFLKICHESTQDPPSAHLWYSLSEASQCAPTSDNWWIGPSLVVAPKWMRFSPQGNRPKPSFWLEKLLCGTQCNCIRCIGLTRPLYKTVAWRDPNKPPPVCIIHTDLRWTDRLSQYKTPSSVPMTCAELWTEPHSSCASLSHRCNWTQLVPWDKY